MARKSSKTFGDRDFDSNLCGTCIRLVRREEGPLNGIIVDHNHLLECKARLRTYCDLCRLLSHIILPDLLPKTLYHLNLTRGLINVYGVGQIYDPSCLADLDCDNRARISHRIEYANSALASVESSTQRLDFRELRKMLSECNQNSCFDTDHEKPHYRSPTDITLIDVDEQCLIRASTRMRYLALSYVWGGFSGLQTTSKNRAQLEQAGSLEMAEGEIPAVIRDAITFVRAMRERYL
jgi:hypothetical protein